jgi:hypothetical protein
MILIANGMIASGLDNCPGRLLITDRAIFVVKPTVSEKGAVAFFGLLGLLMAKLYGKMLAPEDGPGYLSDPDLAELSQRDRKSLMDTEMLVKYSISPALKVTPTTTGFMFEDGSTGTSYAGFMAKKKIGAALRERGLLLQGA